MHCICEMSMAALTEHAGQKGNLTSKERQCHANKGNNDDVDGPVDEPGQKAIGNPASRQRDQLILNHVIHRHGIHLQCSAESMCQQ